LHAIHTPLRGFAAHAELVEAEEAGCVSTPGFDRRESFRERPRRLAPAIAPSSLFGVSHDAARLSPRDLGSSPASFSPLARPRITVDVPASYRRAREDAIRAPNLSTRNLRSPRHSAANPAIHNRTTVAHPSTTLRRAQGARRSRAAAEERDEAAPVARRGFDQRESLICARTRRLSSAKPASNFISVSS
jgi:hypothetical protein